MRTIFTLIFLIFIQATSAQYLPVRTFTPTPRGNVYYTNNVPMPNNNYGRYTGITSYKYDYIITLVNDSVFKKFVSINIYDSVHFIDIRKKKEHIILKPADTKKIVFKTSYKDYVGLPNDTCWLFKMGIGRINTYTYIPEDDWLYVAAIQKGTNEPIVGLTKENLLEMVKSNSEAYELAEKGKFRMAIKTFNGWK
jgi:hypothetical protein